MADGFSLNIDDSLLKRLTQADDLINKIADSSQKTSKIVSESFANINNNALKPFVENLNELRKALDKNTETITFKEINAQANKAMDATNALVSAINKINTNSEPKTKNSAIYKIEQDIESAKNRLLELQKLLNFYAKGEGQKALGFVDTSSIQSEANNLMKKLDLLEREKTNMERNAKIRLEQAREQERIDNHWASMQNTKNAIEREAARQASQIAKQNSKEYEESYNERYKMYRNMYVKIEEREKEHQAKIKAEQQKKASDNDKERYELWLMRKKSEEAEHKRVEDEKLRKTQETIARQNEMYAAQEQLRRKNAQVVTNATQARAETEQKYRDYERLFTQAIQREEKLKREADAYESQRIIELQDKKKRAASDMRAIERRNHEQKKREYEELFKAIERTERRQRMLANAQGDSSKGAMNYFNRLYNGDGVKSIDRMNTALNKLRDAQNRLNLNTEEGRNRYKELGKAISTIEKDMRKLTESQDKFSKGQSRLMNTSDQLQRKLALVFSVSAIQGYVNKLIEVRKEFELQQKSLQILLKDKDEADRLWQQTLDLAVKSPFRVKELVTYTKQLAAYRIENSKLHQTTKMLSDVSAGLGVDMQRIILAFGQVRAAQFLRGTELRQFTEAGIPMLEELANLFTELEGRTVSTGDVFERISKRMVLFKDVEQVFERMTSSSGVFYKMQEEQSKTLAGMISNLHDSIDIMLNDIGKVNEETIKGLIQTTRNFVENWRMIGVIIKEAAAAFLLFNLSKFVKGWNMASDAMTMADVTMKGIAGTAGKLRVALTTLMTTISANPWTAFFVALGAAGYAAWEYVKSVDAINKKYDEMSIREVNAIDKLEAYNKKAKEHNAIIKNGKAELEDRNKAEKENDKILNEIKSKYPELASLISKQEDGTIDLTNAIQAQNETLIENIALQQKAKGGLFYDSLDENYKEAIEDFATLQSQMNSIKVISSQAMAKLSQADISPEDYEKYSSLLSEIRKSKDFGSLKTAYDNLTQAITRNGKEVSKQVPILGMFANQWVKVVNAFHSYDSSRKDLMQSFVRQKDDIAMGIQKAYDEAFQKDTSGSQDDAKKAGELAAGAWIEGFLDDFGIIDENIREWAKVEIPKFVTVDVLYPTKEPTPAELEPWAKRVSEAIAKVNNEIKAKNPDATKFDLFPLPDAGQTREQYLNIAKGVLDIAKATYAEGQQIEDQATVNRTAMLKDYAGEVEKILNIIKKDTKGGKGKDWFSEIVNSVQEAHKEYIKLSKTLDEAEAKQLTLAKYSQLFVESITNANIGDISLGELTFETEQGVIDALTMLKDKLPANAKEAHFKIEKALSEITGEVRIKTKIESDTEIIHQIEDMFNDYEISLELQKLNIPPDLAKQLFGVELTDLKLIRKEIEDKIKSALAKGGQEDLVKDLQKQLEKVEEMEDKALKERLKKYSKYLTTAMGERVKIKMEEIRAISEIENTKEFSDDQKELAKQGVRRESQAKLDKLEWEEFKDSGMYVQLFEDLEYASTKSLKSMRTQLEQLKGSLKNLDADDLKHLYNQIEKLDDVLAKRNPFKTFINGLDDYRNAVKNTKQLDDNLSSKQDEYDKAKQIETNTDLKLAKYREEYNQKSKNNKLSKQENDTYLYNISLLESQLRIAREATKIKKEGVEQAQKEVDTNNKIKKFFKESGGEVGKYISQAANAIPQIAESMENVFGTMDAKTRDTIESIAEIGSGIGDTIQSIASGDYIGAIVGLASTIGAIFAIGDKKREREIQSEIEFVGKLGKAYEKLQKKIEDAYSINTLQSTGKKAKENLESQVAAYERMIQAEEAKKKTDKNRIDEWRDSIDDLKEQIADLSEELVSTATAGIMDSVLSASQEFTDAWLEAFRETGNGLSGLEDNFKETMLEMVKQQASMLISQSYVERWKKQLEQYINPSDLELSTEEAKNWVDAVQTSLPQLNQALENYFTAMQQAGVNLGGGELSGLQRGIQELQESTAQEIVAYLNSIRFFVAENNTYLSQIASAFNSGEMENPMVSQLRIIAQQTTAINTLLQSLTKGGHSLGGVGLKVFIS